MIDIHSHIIFDVDDGPSGIDKSAEMAAEALKAGIHTIISTPHFNEILIKNGLIKRNYMAAAAEAKKIGINLLIGYEIRINPLLPETIGILRDITLNNSKFILVEMPFDTIPFYIFDIIYKLQLKGITPIIAHPERCERLRDNPDLIIKLIDVGCLIQLDAASLLGVHGNKSKKCTKALINKRLAHFIASDAHNREGYSVWYRNAYNTVLKWADNEYANELFYKNARNLLVAD